MFLRTHFWHEPWKRCGIRLCWLGENGKGNFGEKWGEKNFEMGRGDSWRAGGSSNVLKLYIIPLCMVCVEGVQSRQNTIFFQFPKSGYFQYFPIFPFSTIFQYFPISRNFQFFPSLQFPKFSSYAEKKEGRPSGRPCLVVNIFCCLLKNAVRVLWMLQNQS